MRWISERSICSGGETEFPQRIEHLWPHQNNRPKPAVGSGDDALARVMGDMVLLPDGTVLIINGVSAGTAGWEYGRNPVLSPVLYQPNDPLASRFQTLNPSQIPRVYHSTAILLRDGRVLVSGSNPHTYYNFSGVIYPTELRLEAYSPAYLDGTYSNLRPKIISPTSQAKLGMGRSLWFNSASQAP
ncbi:hypothetical protein MLD38_034996 [Melastoma candidum]|uniref:Uncharacterized protein n=1 Tax=Melastoma candidum TaxID=119954 RepID=A0ACB9MFG3_9MYRT|nr:hypothetical protein MLD38_034996 [Melastoma candidum]